MKKITTSLGDLYTRTLGNGSRNVVVLHGGPGMSSSYLIEALTPLSETFKLNFFDQISCGKSDIIEDLDFEKTLISSSEVINKMVGEEDFFVISH